MYAPYLESMDAPYLESMDAPYLEPMDAPYLESMDAPYLESMDAPYLESMDAPYPDSFQTGWSSLPGLKPLQSKATVYIRFSSKKLEDISHFGGTTGASVLDFWLYVLGFKVWVDLLLACLSLKIPN